MKVTPANLTLINSKELFKAITRLKKYLLVEPCTRKHIEYGYYADDVLAVINHAPTIDAVEVVHARWVDPCINKYGHPCHHCSACRFKASQKDRNFCPNCGAKMEDVRNAT